MKQFIQKLIDFIPRYTIIPLIIVFSCQSGVYFGTKLINSSMRHRDLTTDFDRATPFITWFGIIYVGCYIFWAINYMLTGKVNKKYFYTFITNIFTGYLICATIFIILPTTIQRPSLDTIHGFGKIFVTYVYATDTPVNLFPSMHCLISWYCYLGVKGQPTIPKWYQIFSLILAVLVCISTLVIKQHYVADVISGILIAEFTYRLVMKKSSGKVLTRFFEAINKRLHMD